MVRGSKVETNTNSFSDGDFFPGGVRRFIDLCKDDRIVPSNRILREIGATKSSWVAWKIEDGSVFIYGIDPDKIEEISVSDTDGVLVLQELDVDKLERCPDGDIHLIQVKSQGRVGTKNQVSEILKKAGISEDDWLIPQFVDNKDEGTGWRLYGLKKQNLIFSLKKGVGQKNADVSSA